MSDALAEWRRAGQSFGWRGHAVFYRDQGHGDRALLLIHGFPTASFDWAKLWPDLVREFPRVIAPDLLGYGFSAKPADHDYTIAGQADLLEELLARLGVRHVHLLAHDYGDTVAQELLARYAQRRGGAPAIESCVLLNGGLFPEVHRARLVQKLLLTPFGPVIGRLMSRRGFGPGFSAIFGAKTRPAEEELDDFWALVENQQGRRVMHRLIRYIPERRLHRERWVGALQRTRVPLRFVNGPDDPVSGAHMVARYRQLIPRADVVELPGIGHYPQVEDPAGVLRALREFHARLQR
ncbi:MAG TPA: alpha/beta hydrolase [Candidatus Binatia bacterium]|nr:alpha/beta hydrolase [Candidatus Binatia bacterium]